MDKLPPPGHLNFDSGNLSQSWKTWKQQFELFLAATETQSSLQSYLLVLGTEDVKFITRLNLLQMGII